MPWLVKDGDPFELEDGKTILGRARRSDIVVTDGLASRVHAIVTLQGQKAVVADQNSRNGTLLNGNPLLEEHELIDGDRITIGTSDIFFHEKYNIAQHTAAGSGQATLRRPVDSGPPLTPEETQHTATQTGQTVLAELVGLEERYERAEAELNLCEADSRGWEWRYLAQRMQSAFPLTLPDPSNLFSLATGIA